VIDTSSVVTVRPEQTGRTASASWVVGTTPYTWPFDGGLDPARCALLVVDDGMVMPASDDRVFQRVKALAAVMSDCGGLVVRVSTQAVDDRRYLRDADPASEPAAFVSGPRVQAAGIDGFFGSPLDAVLRQQRRDQLVLVGHFLEIAVHSTLRSANDRGYECLTVADACASADPSTEAGAISSIEMSGGIFGAVGNTDAVLTAFRQPATLIPATPIRESS
jgi:hypothetical protein